jgi:hypothetical protein
MSNRARTAHDAPTPESFAKDVANHALTIVRDEGVHRHLILRKPGSWTYGFELITWPGGLLYVGDMGCYVFRRIDDMFVFFRDPKGRINPGYWAEKLEAADKCDGFKEFSEHRFREAVVQRFRDFLQDRWPVDDVAELKADIRDQLFGFGDDERESFNAAYEFDSHGMRFDPGDMSCDVYTYRFIWCCRALVWAIQQYDDAKTPVVAPAEQVAA